MDIEAHPFDLRDCVESALDLVSARAAEKRLDIAYLFEGDVPAAVSGDVTRLRQIILNLLGNAVKFTEHGEVVLTVSAAHKPPGVELTFAVRDTGIGLTAAGMGRLFQSFSQADSTTTRKYGGTGLGLAISKRLAELMGGRMWAESEGPGRGATFIFTVIVPVAELPAQSRRDYAGSQPELRGRRVLVVDDNATNRRVLALQTGKWGMAARDTESARRRCAGSSTRGVRPGDPGHAHARDGRPHAGPAHPRAAPRAAAGAVQLARPPRERRQRRPVRRLPGQAGTPVAAVRHAGQPVRARRRSQERRRLPSRASTARWPRATRCASCWPRTTS